MIPIIKGMYGEVVGYNCKVNYESYGFWYKKELVNGEIVNRVIAEQLIDYEKRLLHLKTNNKIHTWKTK